MNRIMPKRTKGSFGSPIFMLILYVIGPIFLAITVQTTRWHLELEREWSANLETKIQVLEQYIEDNGLPTPANPQGEPCSKKPITINVKVC